RSCLAEVPARQCREGARHRRAATGADRMSLDALLKPRSIAVIGASDNPKRIGGVPVDLLKRAGFERLYPVNPKNETIQGLKAYAAIEDVPERVDLVIVALSAGLT